jgi:large subunit ribosomal protein L25
MAISFELNAEPRNDLGKGASRRLRRTGKVPAILYGGDMAPESLSLSHNQLLRNLEHEAFYSHILTINLGGTPVPAILRDLQRHPSRPVVLHVDLQRVNMSEKLRAHVPLHFKGEDESPVVKAGGLVSHELIDVLVECMPKDLPEFIEVDISAMQIGDSIHLSGLVLPAGVTLVELARGEAHDLAVVSMHAKRVVSDEDEGAAPAAESEGGGESS